MNAQPKPDPKPDLVRVSVMIDRSTDQALTFASRRLGTSRSELVRRVLGPEAEFMAVLARYVPPGHDPTTPLPVADAQALRSAILEHMALYRDEFFALQHQLDHIR